jgi:hypothetical protein
MEPFMPGQPDLLSIRNSVDRIGRLSDSIVRLGPFSLGLDGVLSWAPGVGEIYSAAAAGFILVQGARARVPMHVLLTCAALMGSRTVISAVPLAGGVFSDLFTAHKWSARLVVRAIDKQLPAGADLQPPPPRRRWFGGLVAA